MIKLNRRLLLIGILALATSLGIASTFDHEKSKVTFSVRNMKVRTVEGSFSGIKGNVKFDPSNLSTSSFNVCIDASSVDTGSKKRDEHLLKEDFFDVEKYPAICFESNSIIKTKDGYIAIGVLTILDETKKIEIPFTADGNSLNGKITLNRLDYGLGKDTNNFMVSNEVIITIQYILSK